MDYFGVNSAEDLPKIKEVLANQIMEGTLINQSDFEQPSSLAVRDNGELVEEANDTEINSSLNAEQNDLNDAPVHIQEKDDQDDNQTNESSDLEEKAFEDPDPDESEEDESTEEPDTDGDSLDESTSPDEKQ
jgi:segregation and condensation protein B